MLAQALEERVAGLGPKTEATLPRALRHSFPDVDRPRWVFARVFSSEGLVRRESTPVVKGVNPRTIESLGRRERFGASLEQRFRQALRKVELV